jgi:hypothetical protein
MEPWFKDSKICGDKVQNTKIDVFGEQQDHQLEAQLKKYFVY